MQAVILMGGLGTRLRALYPDRPKALVPILGKTYLDRSIEWLMPQGVDEFHLACGYRAEAIAAWLEKRAPGGPRITMSAEPEPLGTAGALKFAEPHIRGQRFLVLNGDSFLPSLDVRALAAAHRGSATLAVTKIEQAGRYGTVEFDDNLRLTAFREKAARDAGWVNGGVYIMDRSVLSGIAEKKASSLETDVFPALAAQGGIGAFQTPPPLLDMGTPEGLAAFEMYLTRSGRL